MPPSERVLSVVIPAYNEQEHISTTVTRIAERLTAASIAYEIVVVDDHSVDATAAEVMHAADAWPPIRCVPNLRAPGFGNAIHTGLDAFVGDAVCIVMADASDDPADIVKYWQALERGFDCAFGTRFTRAATVVDYPPLKLALNRVANTFVALLFGLHYNDVTNAFKAYRREAIDGVRPILSHHFNITVELPLKAIVRGFSWTVVPTNWYNRRYGTSKLKIKEMGSRYLFIVLYALLEKWLTREYRRNPATTPAARRESGRMSGRRAGRFRSTLGGVAASRRAHSHRGAAFAQGSLSRQLDRHLVVVRQPHPDDGDVHDRLRDGVPAVFRPIDRALSRLRLRWARR